MSKSLNGEELVQIKTIQSTKNQALAHQDPELIWVHAYIKEKFSFLEVMEVLDIKELLTTTFILLT